MLDMPRGTWHIADNFFKNGKKSKQQRLSTLYPPPFFNTKKKKKIKCQILHNTAIWYSLYGNLQLINNNSKNRAVCLVSSSYELDNKECHAPHHRDGCVAIEILHDYLHNSSNLYYVTLSSSLFAFFFSLSRFFTISCLWVLSDIRHANKWLKILMKYWFYWE